MTLFKATQRVLASILHDLAREGALQLPDQLPAFVVELPRDPAHGDLATNVAMMLTKAAGKPPRVIADLLKPKLQALPDVIGVEIAGPGFINLRLKPDVWQGELKNILQAGLSYGDSDMGQGERVNVEYVSANPTGPMHAGHVRGAVVGDCLCSLLKKAGYAVTREYYFNDAGAQVDVLARTTHLRYREALGEELAYEVRLERLRKALEPGLVDVAAGRFADYSLEKLKKKIDVAQATMDAERGA